MENNKNLEAKIFRKIRQIPRQDWDAVFPGVLESYDFLACLDDSSFPQFSFSYLMVYDGDSPVGAAPCFTMHFSFDMTVRGPLKKALGVLKRAVPSMLDHKVLMCGIPMAQGRLGIAGDAANVIKAMITGLEEVARREKASILIFKDFSKEYNPLFEPLLRQGFTRIESLPSTDMEIDFKSFDGYLDTLSPVSRSGLRRKFKKVDAAAKLDLEIADSMTDSDITEAHGLYLQTLSKHEDITVEELPEAFFKNVARNMPGKAKFFIWRLEGKMAAFAFCLASPELFIDYYLGFDYSLAYQYQLYFVRFRDLMQWCIDRGIRKYEMGVTGYEAKRRLGFDFIQLYFYIKHLNPLINPFVKVLKPLLEPKRFDPVFKEINKSLVLQSPEKALKN